MAIWVPSLWSSCSVSCLLSFRCFSLFICRNYLCRLLINPLWIINVAKIASQFVCGFFCFFFFKETLCGFFWWLVIHNFSRVIISFCLFRFVRMILSLQKIFPKFGKRMDFEVKQIWAQVLKLVFTSYVVIARF